MLHQFNNSIWPLASDGSILKIPFSTTNGTTISLSSVFGLIHIGIGSISIHCQLINCVCVPIEWNEANKRIAAWVLIPEEVIERVRRVSEAGEREGERTPRDASIEHNVQNFITIKHRNNWISWNFHQLNTKIDWIRSFLAQFFLLHEKLLDWNGTNAWSLLFVLSNREQLIPVNRP